MGFLRDLFALDMMIVFFGGLFAQFMAEVVFLPMIWSPRRIYAGMLGIAKVPWEPPGYFTKNIIILVSMFFFIKYICLLGFQIYTLRYCSKKNFKFSKKLTNVPAMFGMLVYALIYVLPITKIPAIFFKQFIPFVQNLVYGIPMSFAVTFGYYLNKQRIMDDVCGT